MKWFGESWHASVNTTNEHVDTPVGETCAWCNEEILEGDRGFVLPYLSSTSDAPGEIAYHLDCHVRMAVGSVAHQLTRCSCYGGDGDLSDVYPDYKSWSKREEAEKAIELTKSVMHVEFSFEDDKNEA